MRLHSPQFEKALRRGVKRRVRGSPELKREFRRANRFRRHRRVGRIFRPLFAGLAGFVVWAATATTGHVATGLAIINLWMLGSLSLLGQGMWARLHASGDLAALGLLPISRERLFRWQLQKFYRHSLLTLFDLAVCFGALACYCHFSPVKWAAAMAIAALSWATVLALAAFCLVRLPRSPLQIISAGLLVLAGVVFFGRQWVYPIALKAIDQSAPELNLFLPTGWPPLLFQALASGGQWWLLILLLPIAAILGTVRTSLRRLFDGFHHREHLLPEPSDLVPGDETDGDTQPDKTAHLGPTAIEEIIQSRKFLGTPQWPHRGWMEQRLWRWFSRREQNLSDFVFPNGCAITKPWLKTFRNFAIAAVAALAAEPLNPTLKFWILGIGLFVTICQMLAQIIHHGRAFQLFWLSGVNLPLYAGYGIGFRELSRLLLKCSVIQIPFLAAFTLTAGLTTAALIGLPLEFGMIFGLKFGFLLFASRFIFLVAAFSAGTNDTARFRFQAVLLIFLVVVLALGFAGMGGAGLFLPNKLTALMFCLGAGLDAYALFWIYRWFYLYGRFDLMSLPRR